MNPRQRDYFRGKLNTWKEDILRESRETLENLQEESQNHPDMADFCEETGEPIGIARLDARPIATLSLEAQEMHERREKVYRDE